MAKISLGTRISNKISVQEEYDSKRFKDVCDVPKCKNPVYMGYKKFKICKEHWVRHTSDDDKFDINVAFGLPAVVKVEKRIDAFTPTVTPTTKKTKKVVKIDKSVETRLAKMKVNSNKSVQRHKYDDLVGDLLG